MRLWIGFSRRSLENEAIAPDCDIGKSGVAHHGRFPDALEWIVCGLGFPLHSRHTLERGEHHAWTRSKFFWPLVGAIGIERQAELERIAFEAIDAQQGFADRAEVRDVDGPRRLGVVQRPDRLDALFFQHGEELLECRCLVDEPLDHFFELIKGYWHAVTIHLTF